MEESSRTRVSLLALLSSLACAVTVRDELGGAIAGTVVYLLPMDGMTPASGVISAVTDRLGRARLNAIGGKPYAVVIALSGFTPLSKPILFERGCSGRLGLTLKAML
jgi:hypothetical protein